MNSLSHTSASGIELEDGIRLQNPLTRTIQRYFIPRFIISLYYYLRYRCYISTQSKVQLSKQVSFGKGTVVKPFAIIQTQAGKITIGKHCAISSFNHISTGIKDVTIGDYVRIGPSVTIMGGSREFRRKDFLIMDQGAYHANIHIGDDVLIGASAIILPGCTIGNGAVIGAASVVNKDIPPYSIVAHAPARIVGQRE